MGCPRNNPPGSCDLPNVHCRYPECDRETPIPSPERERLAKEMEILRSKANSATDDPIQKADMQKVDSASDRLKKALIAADAASTTRYGAFAWDDIADALLAAGWVHRDDAAKIADNMAEEELQAERIEFDPSTRPNPHQYARGVLYDLASALRQRSASTPRTGDEK